jgi:hypothetical protein
MGQQAGGARQQGDIDFESDRDEDIEFQPEQGGRQPGQQQQQQRQQEQQERGRQRREPGMGGRSETDR